MRNHLAELLREMGLECVTASREEAETRLGAQAFEVVFVDPSDEPGRAARVLAALENAGRRPATVVLRASAPGGIPAETWSAAGVQAFLADPFAIAQVRGFVERTLDPLPADGPGPPHVMVMGGGPWIDALDMVLAGAARFTSDMHPATLLERVPADRPAVMLIGPPLAEDQAAHTTAILRKRLPPSVPIIAVLEPRHEALREELAAGGAVQESVMISDTLEEVVIALRRAGGITRRASRRARVEGAACLQREAGAIFADLHDLSEGGLCIHLPDPDPPDGTLQIQFALPGQIAMIETPARVAWTKTAPDGVRAGLAFGPLAETDLERIRRYLLSARLRR